MEGTYAFFSRLIGTLAVILLVSAFIGGSRILNRFKERRKDWRFILLSGLAGGLFGMFGNISGIDANGALISVRDMGPMFSGLVGGPISGLIAGVIAGCQRLSMGGITAQACVVATSIIGVLCGILFHVSPNILKKPLLVLLCGALMEALHLGIVLIMVKPFSTALQIVKQIALPFITVNAIGLCLMTVIIHFFEKQQQITLDRERMKSELEVATVIQNSLLPAMSDRYPGRPELKVNASMQAAKSVGGDFYDVFFIDDDRLVFLIGDVSGKGVPAALFMACAKVILQNCIRMTASLSEGIAFANNVLCRENEAELFVTVWAGVLDLQTGHLTYVSAGHNPPVLARNGHAVFLTGKNGFVLAGMEDVKYTESEMKLLKGDTVYLYTDGVTEAMNTEGECFGNDRLLKCMTRKKDADPDFVVEEMKTSLKNFVGDAEQFDDITMLCFQWEKQT